MEHIVNIIVTGGAGFIGSNLVDCLISNNHNVVVVDNLRTGKIENVNSKAKFLEFDVSDNWLSHEFLNEFSCDTIFHLAALPRIRPSFLNPQEVIAVNCLGTVNMLEYAKNKKAKVILAGSSSVLYDSKANPYTHSKFIAEEHCVMYNKVFGISVAIARFFNVYGKRHISHGEFANVIGTFERQTKQKKQLSIFGTGEKRRDFTHVNDVCSALLKMHKNFWDAQIFNIGRAKNYSINEVADMFKPIGIDYFPSRSGEAQETLADISQTKEILKWEPQYNLEDYVSTFLSTCHEA